MPGHDKPILDAIAAFQSQHVYPAVGRTITIDDHGFTICVTELELGDVGRRFMVELTFGNGEEIKFFEEISKNYFE
jgi:hypothetical protein